jgi:hypothetical protein
MAQRKRGPFGKDLGDHPPEIAEFLADLHGTSRGNVKWSLGPKLSAEEVEANARWFGKLLLVVAFACPILVWWLVAGEVTRRAVLVAVTSSLVTATLGAAFLWTYRKR